ncbi:HNH endonuclease [Saccharothrix australiensis]|uniref:HNH endonuclease n=1 Tax=Saccharothrix australiensis TaxID=2072 RepID=A0A495VXT9_9PSEU|nr:HNH endonuclease [Saccharothrix australiensis]RKT53403.1 HNH endonuclease [Saccharothrix australiensis]
MIRLSRTALPDDLAGRLVPLTDEITAAPDRVRTARAAWKRAAVRRSVHAPLRRLLEDMAPGHQRCMYCGDSQGTDIDHFEPLSRNPLRTFDWLNHLLACSTCNSNLKRDRFPLAGDGTPLLVDPTAEDPFDHLLLTLALGTYVALTPKGQATIDVCGLNRPVLTRGREQARRVVVASLLRWARGRDRGAADEMREAVLTVRWQPFADVCQSMLRLALMPGAARVLDEPVLSLLRDRELRDRLLV